MPEHNMPGDSVSERLLSRSDPGLSRRRMADGGEVYTGGLAQRALRTLGARAFTMDGSIFVDPSFDASKPEDVALYAHERHHQRESGGAGGDRAGHPDAEERHAQAVEQKVLHRIEQSGEDPRAVLADLRSTVTPRVAPAASTFDPSGRLESGASFGGDDGRDPMQAYWQLRAEGLSHRRIVEQMRDHVIENVLRLQEEHGFRSGGESDFLG